MNSLVGQVLGGRYHIEQLLGMGGMSAVYKARDPNLQRAVAIKLIHSHLSDNEEFVRRFESEATSIARLRHPNIVQVYDFSHDGDLYYMVLEYLAGETLQMRIKRLNEAGRRLPLVTALTCIRDVCLAADYAHERGMIHRDIKPANIMLKLEGGTVLMDFGIAHLLGGSQHTATGTVLGTALYMSPEQIQGLHPDRRADIYSIGVTLFESLSGRPPFEADSVMTLMMMHMNDPVPDLGQFQADIPAPVRAIVERALAKNRANRYQTCAEMAAALSAAIQGLSEGGLAAASTAAATPPQARRGEPADATIIEPVSEATIIEQVAALPADPARMAGQGTFIEQPAPVSAPGGVPCPRCGTLVRPGVKFCANCGTLVQQEAAAPRRKSLVWAAAAVLLLAVLGAGGFFLYPKLAERPQASALSAALPTAETTATAQPSATAAPSATATLAPEPSATPAATETTAPAATATAVLPTDTPAPPPPPVIGGADMLAFVQGNNIWIAHMDGSALQQLTSDGAVKSYLRWLPGGQQISYISGKCIQLVSVEGIVSTLTCFNNAEIVESFEVSPDGTRVALSVDHLLYLLPYDLERLAKVNSHPDLVGLADCKELAPYQRNNAVSARWSKDGKTLAVVALGVLADQRRGEIVQLIAVDRCIANPLVQVQFPQPHFTFSAYNTNPVLTGFTWDGESVFVMNANTRNDGFGDLHIFNRDTFKADLNVNPINKNCCYRNPQFSPDGTYIVFAFQDIALGAESKTALYYISYGSINTGVTYTALPLPEFTNPREAPYAVLRPAAVQP